MHRITRPVNRVFVHHGASPTPTTVAAEKATVRGYQTYHMDTRRWNDIAYSWLVGQSGTRFEGRGWGVVGGHTAGHNSTSYAVCAIGNFDVDAPSDELLEAIAVTIVDGIRAGHIARDARIDGHRDASGASTACPGRHLYAHLPQIRLRVRELLGEVSPPPAQKPAPAPKPAPVESRKRVWVRSMQTALNSVGERLVVDGIPGPKTSAAMRRHMVGWPTYIRRAGGNPGAVRNERAVVRAVQAIARERWAPDIKVDGLVGPQTNHVIVVLCGQRDGILGPAGLARLVG